jgi:hypothetical protein
LSVTDTTFGPNSVLALTLPNKFEDRLSQFFAALSA